MQKTIERKLFFAKRTWHSLIIFTKTKYNCKWNIAIIAFKVTEKESDAKRQRWREIYGVESDTYRDIKFEEIVNSV